MGVVVWGSRHMARRRSKTIFISRSSFRMWWPFWLVIAQAMFPQWGWNFCKFKEQHQLWNCKFNCPISKYFPVNGDDFIIFNIDIKWFIYIIILGSIDFFRFILIQPVTLQEAIAKKSIVLFSSNSNLFKITVVFI